MPLVIKTGFFASQQKNIMKYWKESKESLINASFIELISGIGR